MPNTQTIPVNDIAMHVRTEGAGIPVLLVHGFPLDHTMWDAQVEVLAEHCRVIAPDLRGYGATELADAGDPPKITMQQYADDLAALLDALGVDEPVVYAGFSMGGYIGWQFVKNHRDKLRALVLVDTRASDDADDARKMRLKMANHVQEWGAEKVAEAMIPKLFAESSLDALHPMVARTREVISATNPLAIAAAQRGMAERPDSTPDLAGINVPTMAIVGAEDQLSQPEEVQRVVNAIPNAGLVVIPAAGHMAPVEQPDAVNLVLTEFVKSLNA
ncbi:AB hydrolase superfamily protein YdjP [Posidoniimonas polymericola]|uniref:AB hydrolase superfamily protein YdjP n=1 Tax=Posidoniimonas polymericola TaxID=2528002 RepID=A0A5C5ZEV6_9BACT|nr:alpha/beta hydrolase [Posidoniimonas polymericola]TWT85670.1 AB hydrolase superfamily protein YdjP [Posidoniimonas polymericola]